MDITLGLSVLCILLGVWAIVATRHMLRYRRISRTNLVTGLPNFRGFKNKTHSNWKLLRKNAPVQYVLVYIDLDNFKCINDTHSHAVADKVLRRFGTLLLNTIRATDVAGHPSGDEFLLWMPECDVDHVHTVMQRLRERCRNDKQLTSLLLHGNTDTPTCTTVKFSYGVRDVSATDTMHLTEALVQADKAMQVEKQARRTSSSR